MASSPSSTLPDPALPAPPLASDDCGFTAEQLIARQSQLEEAAREAVPFSFAKGGCTYERGYIKQPVYSCRSCGGGGVCAGCSVGCHATHDLVELFAKRSFRCDCGTLSLCREDKEKESSIPPCSLRGKTLVYAPQNDQNVYSKNYEGVFCRCERGKEYNAETEEETMFQCLCCEDWLHESCTSLRPSREIDDIDSLTRDLADGPLVDHDSFEQFICNECVRQPGNEALLDYLGHKGWIVCLPTGEQYLPDSIDDIPAIKVEASGKGWSHSWKVFGLIGWHNLTADEAATNEEGAAAAAAAVRAEITKRKLEDGLNQKAKRARVSEGIQVLDSFSDVDQDEEEDEALLIYEKEDEDCTAGKPPLFARPDAKPLRLDIFLTESFRERICRCKNCLPDFKNLPFLLEAEKVYSPPRSDTSSQDAQSEGGASQNSSTYDLGLAALQRLPRAQMMESLEAYNKMRDALFAHLRPFASEGRVVDGESMREFFRKQKEEQSALTD
ncbi:hypothetical protein CBS101457_006364 [Exobasidium rhododendri]|nr:hypothetical protein CBS101457_006364 [Exobasidium rhododendri]